MSLAHGTKIVRDGLVFAYDMGNNKSWVGAPTENIIHWQNAVAQSSYEPYVQTTSGSWASNHPDAIRAYNASGSQITGYVNTGVGDYTNKYHGIWTYDDILRKPVVTLRDFDASWKAKSFSMGTTMNALGLGYGDSYTISWLQWVDNIAKKTRTGVYGQNTSGSNGFHEGLVGPANTKTHTWERVYLTRTVSSVRNLASNLSIYMYGHYDTRATIKIADVQFEVGDTPSKFCPTASRSNTEALLDFTGNHTLTVNNNYTNEGNFNFTQQSHSITLSPALNIPVEKTLSFWLRSDRPLSVTDNWEIGFVNSGSTVGTMFGMMYGVGNCQDLGFWGYGSNYDMSVESATNKWSSDGNWHQCVITMDGLRNVKVWIDGEQKQWLKHSDYSTLVDSVAMPTDTTNNFVINSRGPWNGGMSYVDVGLVLVYDRDLTDAEIKQNYEATKGRFS